MGYRTYLGSMSKDKHKQIEDMTQAEFQAFTNVEDGECDYFSVLDFAHCNFFNEYLFEFGKDYEVKNNNNKVFSKFSDEDSDLIIISKEECYMALDEIRVIVHKGYMQELDVIKNPKTEKQIKEVMKKDFDLYYKEYGHLSNRSSKEFLLGNIKQKIRIWSDSNTVSDSWLWEYEYFRLKYLLDNFDWKKNVMVYYGY